MSKPVRRNTRGPRRGKRRMNYGRTLQPWCTGLRINGKAMGRMAGGLLALAVLGVPVLGRAGSPQDPANVLDQMEVALNVGNADAFLAWFASNGVIKEQGGKSYTGKAQL